MAKTEAEPRMEAERVMAPVQAVQEMEPVQAGRESEETRRKEKEKGKKKVQTETLIDDIPSFRLGISEVDTPEKGKGEDQKKKGPLVVKIPLTIGEQKGRRTEKVSGQLKSPYHRRTIDISKNTTALETKVAEWIFSLQGDTLEVVFESRSGHSCFRVMIESLYPESEAYSNVIDTWAILLNEDEKLRSPDSPRRFFCTTEVLPEEMFGPKPNHDKNMKLFWKNFTDLVEQYGALEEVKKFDLVFFPVVKQSHYYLICFDLKNGSIAYYR